MRIPRCPGSRKWGVFHCREKVRTLKRTRISKMLARAIFFSVRIKLNYRRKKSARASKIEKRIKILLALLVLHGAPVSNVTD